MHALIGDIGGTNARFALTDLGSAQIELVHQQSLANEDFASLHHAIEHYLAGLGVRPVSAALAVACPVQGDDIRLTNRAWAFSRSELKTTLALQALSVVNDFGAIGWAATALPSSDLLPLFDAPISNGRGPITLIGPGTGLGVALLAGSADSGWSVIETEGGHVSFAPQNDEESMIAAFVSARFGRCSNERLLSGQGLSFIDGALRGEASAHSNTLREPKEIVDLALDGHDVFARRALARFCAVLGSVLGDAALIHGARSVLIAGGIVPRFIPYLKASACRERYLAKGRFADYLAKVPVHVITHPFPGLLGAAVALRSGAGLETGS